MGASVIRARLDLVIKLADTTTGAAVEERNVLFKKNGQSIRPDARDTGTYILINTGREDFLMQIQVYGYEEAVIPVKYEELDERIPELNVFLIPSEDTSKGERLLSFSGTLPFLEAIDAVRPGRVLCSTTGYDEKKKILSYFAQSGAELNWGEPRYGMLNADKTAYEEVEIVRSLSTQSAELKEKPKEDCTSNLTVTRIVHGVVGEDGTFLIRVRDDGEDLKYLVRYRVKGEDRFQMVDFTEADKTELTVTEDTGSEGITGKGDGDEPTDSDGGKPDVQLRDGTGTPEGNVTGDGTAGG